MFTICSFNDRGDPVKPILQRFSPGTLDSISLLLVGTLVQGKVPSVNMT